MFFSQPLLRTVKPNKCMCKQRLVAVLGFLAIILYTFCYYSLHKSVLLKSNYTPQFLTPSQKSWLDLRQLDCNRFFEHDTSYIHSYVRNKRIVLLDDEQINVSCPAIHSRWHFAQQPNTEEEAEFPLAFARTVFTVKFYVTQAMDYSLLEHMLSVEYQPHNIYCYSLDAKAKTSFKQRMRSLASCFSNVFVLDKEYSVFSNGKNVTRSHLSCLQKLYQQSTHGWKYAFLLQNHDIPLKTNWEKVKILELYKGANDISALRIMPISVVATLNWTMASLHLYKDEKRNRKTYYNEDGSLKVLKHTKSFNLVALSRRAVQFVMEDLQLDLFIDQLEKSKYGMDEVFFSTLNTNLPDFPGGFTDECLKRKRLTNNMGRYTLWQFDGRCMSRKFRHDICVFGVEDLKHIDSQLFQFYINKMLPNFDYAVIFCWLEKLKDVKPAERQINFGFYENMPHVRFNQLKLRRILYKDKDFDCA